jgi:hypothetical protein
MYHDNLVICGKRCSKLALLLLLCFANAPVYAGTEVLSYEDQALTLDGESKTVRVPKGSAGWMRRAC